MIEFLMYETDNAKAELFRAVVKSLFIRLKTSYRLTICHTAGDALDQMGKNPYMYDIIFISMNDESIAKGLADTVRRRDIKTAIVFLGDNCQGLCRLLSFRPSAMLSSTMEPENLMREIYAVYKEQKKQNRYFLIRNRGDIERIPYEQIDFFESSNR